MSARTVAVAAALMFSTQASASIDPRCAEIAAAGVPADYSEQAQQDYLQNYFALSSSFSPVHGPVPHEPGHGAVGLDLGVIPPLPCERRLVLSYTKTEDTNKSPLLPRPRVTFSLPAIGQMVPYAGFAYLPPVKLLGVTNVILSGEAGVGFRFGEIVQFGGRFHATTHKTVGEIATPFVEGDPAFDDLYNASTFGADLMFGLDLDPVSPYVSVGLLDVSTFFFIGDDSVVVNNFHPYAGPVASIGLDALATEHLRLAGELYAAAGGHSRPDKTIESLEGFGRYGRFVTGRIRVAYEF